MLTKDISGALQQKIRVNIRRMFDGDMPEILRIERHSFEFPWTQNDFIKALNRRDYTSIGIVAEYKNCVVGSMIYELHKTCIHISNLAVDPIYRRSGVGKQMLAEVLPKPSLRCRKRIFLEVRETNLVAQLFFFANGFHATGVTHHYYEDTPEDAYLMQYE